MQPTYTLLTRFVLDVVWDCRTSNTEWKNESIESLAMAILAKDESIPFVEYKKSSTVHRVVRNADLSNYHLRDWG